MTAATLNKSKTPRARPLEGRTALITGSTSGIGLGVAEALAGEGARILLNGFGDPQTIMRTRDKLATEHDVEVCYSGADVGSSRVDLQACKLEYSIVSPK